MMMRFLLQEMIHYTVHIFQQGNNTFYELPTITFFNLFSFFVIVCSRSESKSTKFKTLAPSNIEAIVLPNVSFIS